MMKGGTDVGQARLTEHRCGFVLRHECQNVLLYIIYTHVFDRIVKADCSSQNKTPSLINTRVHIAEFNRVGIIHLEHLTGDERKTSNYHFRILN